MGVPMLVMLKPFPVTVAWVRVTLEPPLLVIVADALWLLPTGIVPNATGFELTASTPGVTTVADNPTLRLGLAALLAMRTLPVAGPEVCAVNVTVRSPVPLPGIVIGKLLPATENPAPSAVAWETVTLAVPLLEMARVLVCELPTSGLPKLTGVAVNCPTVVPEVLV